MSRRQSQYTPFKPEDYNQPTEPLDQVPLPPFMGPAPGVSSGVPTAPASQEPAYPYHQQPAAYPVLPQTPLKRYRGTPPGGATRYARPVRSLRRSAIPGLVGLFLLVVQLALLARVLCVLFGVQNTTSWLTLLFAASDLFVLPVRVLATDINLSFLAGTQLLVVIELLAAILVYGILSRLLVRLLKVLFNS